MKRPKNRYSVNNKPQGTVNPERENLSSFPVKNVSGKDLVSESSGKVSCSFRIPEGLHKHSLSYSDSIGISLNGLVCVALDEYLSSRTRTYRG